MSANIAVTSGITAAITATWAEVERCSAKAIKMGQPKTVPRVVKIIGRQRARGRESAFALTISGNATTSAIRGRANAVKRGSKLRSANFVSGSDAEKRNTPRKAKLKPFF